jgi:hypothetical protein
MGILLIPFAFKLEDNDLNEKLNQSHKFSCKTLRYNFQQQNTTFILNLHAVKRTCQIF